MRTAQPQSKLTTTTPNSILYPASLEASGKPERPVSPHARKRMQQRGIPRWVTELLERFGCWTHDHRGGETVHFSKRSVRLMRDTLPRELYIAAERFLRAYMVIGEDGSIVTVAWQTRHYRRP